MTTPDASTARLELERAVTERARHSSKAKAQDTWSFARAERLLGNEYHGRFLIELLQNAADAWRATRRDDSKCDLVVVIEEEPGLLVANKGAAFPAQIVLESLGQIGLSSKHAGEAIGHKGIGFKSTLEVSPTPEIYSTFTTGEPALAVRFDAAQARELIRMETPRWEEWVGEQDEFAKDPRDAVPVLRYPMWVDAVPDLVRQLGGRGYQTVVRLPHSAEIGTTDSWLTKVRKSLEDVSDQILTLLGIFDRVRIEDRLTGQVEEVSVTTEPVRHTEGTATDRVRIWRNGICTSRWARYQRRFDRGDDLASEVAVAIRLDAQDERRPRPAHDDPETSSPFHLFFPTRIGSGLPFLLHGYFEVDAARTGFFVGSNEENQSILDALADLVVYAVGDLAGDDDVDLTALAELIAATPPPETRLARHFYQRVLAGLDEQCWIPGAPGVDTPRAVAPRDTLPIDKTVTEALVGTFPVAYLRERTGREIAHPALSESVHRFLANRRPDFNESWPALHAILRPQGHHPWPHDERADQHFLALLDLADALRRFDPGPADELLGELLGDEEARLIPVVRPGGSREFVGVPNPEGSVAGARGVSVMARLGATTVEPLHPPKFLDVEFLADGLLTEETRARAEALGIRPFTVDAVLDRLNFTAEAADDENNRARLVRFLWDLLTRERRSDLSTTASSGYALSYAAHRWFWLQPGRARQEESARQRQRRERNLAGVPLPARNGTWHPAGTLAFGADWAEWIETNLAYADSARRAAAMRRLDRLAPDQGRLLASPEIVLAHLPPSSILNRLDDLQPPVNAEGVTSPDAERDDVESTSAGGPTLEQFAFLLRLGCWEVPPVEGHETGRPDADRMWPWPALRHRLVPEETTQEWNFETWQWGGAGHRNITVTEDARLLWKLDHDDHDLRVSMAAALAGGAALYASLGEASALCPRCSTPAGNYHSKLYRTHDHERRPSTLVLQLRQERWLPTTRAGEPIGAHRADEAWADTRGLDAHAMRTSPLRHLPLVDVTGWPTVLRSLCDLQALDNADPARLLRLHQSLRTALEDTSIDLATGNARQSFIGLHRIIYEALSNQHPDLPVPDDFEVLCEMGSRLVYRRTGACRHDDGKHVGYRPRFTGQVPFVVLARDKGTIAKTLGIPTFEVSVERRDADPGEDITDSLGEELSERIPELLAVMVHYAGGTAPLEPTSDAFRERASRLSKLRVRRLNNLVLTITVLGMSGTRETVGDNSQDESYLDTSKSGTPVIYHDFSGEGWRSRLRRRLGQHLAALSDVAASYTDTFTLLLTASEEEREDLLRSWGVTPDHVHQIRTQLGIYTATDRTRASNWLRAILATLGHPTAGRTDALDHAGISVRLVAAGLNPAEADVVAHGITNDQPGNPAGSVLRTLYRHGLNLRLLSEALAAQHEPRLALHVARDRLQEWRDRHGSRLAAVLTAAGADEAAAKTATEALTAPADLAYELDPRPEQYLAPVVILLAQQGVGVQAWALVRDAPTTLADLVGWDVTQLDEHARELYDDEARAQRLRELARGWARELKLLSLIARANGSSATIVRSEAAQVDELLSRPETPAELVPLLGQLLPGEHLTTLRHELRGLLVDDIPGAHPDRGQVHRLAQAHGLPVSSATAILKTLHRDRSKRVATYSHQVRALVEACVEPRPPTGLAPPPTALSMGSRKSVTPGTVSVDIERRKKKAGDEAESWALTAMIKSLLDLSPEHRDKAIAEMTAMLTAYGFEGTAIERVQQHAIAAREADLDEEELIDRLAVLLHVAAFSDGFGFDLLGWVSDKSADGSGYPVALEVKAASGSFFFSSGEWACAERMRGTDDTRAAYAVLAVRRSPNAGAPTAMDLLLDPVHLWETGRILREADTYRMRYASTEEKL